MRCEICNRSMTETFLDGAGDEHEYCLHCSEEIQDTLESYDDDEDSWFFEAWDFNPDLDETLEDVPDAEIYEGYQGVTKGLPD